MAVIVSVLVDVVLLVLVPEFLADPHQKATATDGDRSPAGVVNVRDHEHEQDHVNEHADVYDHDNDNDDGVGDAS